MNFTKVNTFDVKQESEERRPVCGLLELAGSLTYARMLHIMVLG